MYVVNQRDLPFSEIAHSFVGADHEGLELSFLMVQAQPGQGPSLHQHAYAEVVVVIDGEARFAAGEEQQTVASGDVVVIPANTPHSFVNTGERELRQIDIHLSPRFVTEWLNQHANTSDQRGK